MYDRIGFHHMIELNQLNTLNMLEIRNGSAVESRRLKQLNNWAIAKSNQTSNTPVLFVSTPATV